MSTAVIHSPSAFLNIGLILSALSSMLIIPIGARDSLWSRGETVILVACCLLGVLMLVNWTLAPTCCSQHRFPGNLGYSWVAFWGGLACAWALRDSMKWGIAVAWILVVVSITLVALNALQYVCAWPHLAGGGGPDSFFNMRSSPMSWGIGPTFYRSYGLQFYALPNGVALATLTIVALVLGTAWRSGPGDGRQDWKSNLALSAACGFTLCVVLSGSRAAAGTVLIVIALLTCFVLRGKRSAPLICLGIVCLLAIGLHQPLNIPGSAHGAIDRIPIDGRWEYWSTTWSMIGDRPLIGHGRMDAFQAAYIAKNGPDWMGEAPASAHNDFLSSMAFYGIPVGVAHALLLFSMLFVAWLRRENGGMFSVALILGAILLGLTHSTFHDKGLAMLLYVAIGASLGACSIRATRAQRAALQS